MDVTKEIEKCTEKIIQNLISECQWNDKLLQPMDLEGWKELVEQRSAAIRSFFVENEECIQKLRAYCAGPLNRNIVDALYESARAMLLQGRMDPALICEISDPVADYYIAEGMTEKAIIISMIRNACMLDYYNRMNPGYHFEKLEASYQYITSRKEQYCSFSNIHARENIFYAYSNLIMMYVQISDERKDALQKGIDYLKEVNAFWSRPEVQALDGSSPGIIAIVNDINFSIPLEFDFASPGDEKIAAQVMDLLDDYCETHRQGEGWDIDITLKLIGIRQKEYRGEIPPGDAVTALLNLVEQLPEPEWEEDVAKSQTILLLFSYIHMMTMKIMRCAQMLPSENQQVTLKMLRYFHEIVEKLPYQYLASYVNDVFKAIFSATLLNISDVHMIESLIYELLIHRQPSTYFHSRMVEQIALIIAEEMIAKEPELFLTLPGYSNVARVLENKEELLETVARGARLHDIGKCCVASVIMRQSRKIGEDEFQCIKAHPDLGAEFLKEKPEFKIYFDIIRGHHKTYDGKGGYPASYDNTASPYRILIDLISICDSTDAATDTTGRNYTPGKDFNSLLRELQEGAGKRYNPDIVRLISDSPEVIEKLSELTSVKRIEYSYEAYSKCLHFD